MVIISMFLHFCTTNVIISAIFDLLVQKQTTTGFCGQRRPRLFAWKDEAAGDFVDMHCHAKFPVFVEQFIGVSKMKWVALN